MDVHRYRTGMHGMNRTHAFFFLGVLLFLLVAPHLAAQPNLNFKRIWLNSPTVEIYFQVGCGGVPIYNMSKQDFRLIEDGHEIKDFTLWCPDPTARCAISVSLVFDASGSMMGSGNAGAKQAGHTFIDLMDGVVDEAAIIWFTSVVTVRQQMSSSLPMLHAAVDALPADGATALWDGIYFGIVELINSGVNQCRAVIALTDGGDNSSTRTVTEIIALAHRHHIRVYTVGVGTSINSVELDVLAQLTGGRFYQTPNAAEVATIYAEIARIIFHHFEECSITYERDCQDGKSHSVELQLRGVCGGSDAKSKTYLAPLDSSVMRGLQFHLSGSDCIAGGETDVTLDIGSSDTTQLAPLTFTLAYDRLALELLSVMAAPGSPLDGKSVSFSDAAEGAVIQIHEPWESTAAGPLLRFRFRADMPPGTGDSVGVYVTAMDPAFVKGCHLPRFDSTSFTIFRRGANLQCALNIPVVRYDTLAQEYVPSPVPVYCQIVNIGTTVSDTIDLNIVLPPGVALAPGEQPVLRLQPPVLRPGEQGLAMWNLVHPLMQTQYIHVIGVRVPRFAGDAGQLCEQLLVVPPVPSLSLQAECAVQDTLVFDPRAGGYEPDPMMVFLSCRNIGTMTVRNVTGRVILPPGLEFAFTQFDTRSFTPATIQPWTAGDPLPTISWFVRWTGSTIGDFDLPVRFEISGEDLNGHVIDTISTTCIVHVRGREGAWACMLDLPDSLSRNLSGTDVEPNPFTVRYTIKSNFSQERRLKSVVLDFPPGELELHPSSANPAYVPLDLLLPADGDWSIEWTLHAPPRSMRRLSWIGVTALDSAGVSTECRDLLPIANVDTAVSSVHADARVDRFTLYPNPAEHELSVEVVLSRPSPTLLLLHDLLGRERRRVSRSDAQLSFTERIDLRGLEAGVYMLQLNAGEMSHSRMLLLR